MAGLATIKNAVRSSILKVCPDFYLKNFWEKRGKIYSKEELSPSYRIMYDDLAKMCLEDHPTKVLEYGCVYGYLLKQIFDLDSRREVCELWGNDFSSTQIDNAKTFFPEGKFFQADITQKRNDFDDKYFDVVVGVGVLMYIQPDKINQAIKELFRVSKSRVYAVEYYHKYLTDQKKESYESVMSSDGRCIYDYVELFKEQGFKHVRRESIDAFEDKQINKEGSMPHSLIIADK